MGTGAWGANALMGEGQHQTTGSPCGAGSRRAPMLRDGLLELAATTGRAG
jgi:hypothetical protein